MASVQELILAAEAQKSPAISAMEGLARGYAIGQQQELERAKILIELEQNKRQQEQIMENNKRIAGELEARRKRSQMGVGMQNNSAFPQQKLEEIETQYAIGPDGNYSEKTEFKPNQEKVIFATDTMGQAVDPFSGQELTEQKPGVDYQPISISRPGQTRYNPSQQSSYMDSFDNTPVFWDVQRQSYLRVTDKQTPQGNIAPVKGNPEAVTSAARGVTLLKNVDSFFDKLEEGSAISQRARLTPGIRQVFNPEVERFTNELKQVGFSFGGKQLTGTEEEIIMGTFVPNALDNKESRLAKREALKAYLGGNIDLMAAANLLGTQGQQIKEVLKKYTDSGDGAKIGRFTVTVDN
ncbi:MAG: hypothetical protein IPN19_11325 [Elusimicrobia bacterium]|nr:hypothetical protein [Elusimicrobiota bacterium]